MADDPTFCPNWTSPPGETIAAILRERSVSLEVFSDQLSLPIARVKELIDGRTTITLGLARQLAQLLGASAEFWISRDFNYREDSARLAAADREWLADLPIGDMVRFGWLTPAPRPSEEVTKCLNFFGVPTIQAWRDRYPQAMAAFRTSASFDSRPGAVAAWLRKGELEAETVDCAPWDADRFKEVLSDVRALTRLKDPQVFLPQLQERCAQAGVAVAIVRAPAGCRASGATKFLSTHKALLLLSFRYLTDDHFWFSFFHEAGHLFLHGKERLFLEGTEALSTGQEQEANEFAAHVLVPREHQGELRSLPVNKTQVLRFAKRLGVSPGIVVGQMQHARNAQFAQLNGLKRRFEWFE